MALCGYSHTSYHLSSTLGPSRTTLKTTHGFLFQNSRIQFPLTSKHPHSVHQVKFWVIVLETTPYHIQVNKKHCNVTALGAGNQRMWAQIPMPSISICTTYAINFYLCRWLISLSFFVFICKRISLLRTTQFVLSTISYGAA